MRRTIFSFQYFRGLSCLLVALLHFEPHINVALAETGVSLEAFRYYGYYGVDLFFMISGFVIWLTTVKVDPRYSWENAKVFAIKRLIRVYLPYLTIITGVLLVYYLFDPSFSRSPVELAKIITLYPYPFYRHPIPVSWTLSYEVIFYICFTLLLFFGLSVKSRLRLIYAIVIVILAFNCYTDVYLQVNRVEWLSSHFPTIDPMLLTYFSAPYWLNFCSGIILAHLWLTKHRLYVILGTYISVWWVIIGIGIIFGCLWYFKIDLDRGDGFNFYRVLLCLPLFFLLLITSLYTEEEAKLVKPNALLMLLGDASYLIYLVHTVYFTMLYWLRIDHYLQVFGLWSLPLMLLLFIVMVAVCCIATRYLELPLYRMISEALTKRVTKVNKPRHNGSND